MAQKRPNTVLSVYDIDLVGIHYVDEFGTDAVRMAAVEPNGVVHLFPETVQNTRFFVRAAGWIKDGVAALRGDKPPEDGGETGDEHVSGL